MRIMRLAAVAVTSLLVALESGITPAAAAQEFSADRVERVGGGRDRRGRVYVGNGKLRIEIP